MQFTFDNKTIFILSSERWGIMKVSKHHYAMELAERGNKVYFIEPADLKTEGISVNKVEGYDSLFVVKYKPLNRGERFLPTAVYNWLVRLQVKKLIKHLGGKPDVLWNFNPYRFPNLHWFGAKVNILHMMDISIRPYFPPEARTADICLGVTDSLIRFLQPSGKPVYFVNHGLSRRFIANSQAAIATDGAPVGNGQVTVGYVGNLLMGAVDRETMLKVIRQHPEVRFVFWGQYKFGQDALDAHRLPEVQQFSDALQAAPNVVLKGPVPPEVLSKEIGEADCFWLCYKKDMTGVWEGSNSHKLLEYLITGKPVVTHKVETYEHYEDILYMVKDLHNDNYPALFDRVVGDLGHYSSTPLRKARIDMALANAYANHIDFIANKISEKGLYR